MLKMNLQLFAHKKGVGSTKNGRDSESKRLGAKRPELLGVKRAQADWSVCLKSSGLNPVMGWKLPI